MTEDPIERLFRQHRGSEIFVLLNKGNKGDGLVHFGGRSLMDKYQIKYKEIKFPCECSGNYLFVYGCGGFSKPHHHMVEYVNFYIGKFKKIVILPCSLDLSVPQVQYFIQNFSPSVEIFCRERYSFNEVLKNIPVELRKNVHLSKDMSFHGNYERWKKNGAGTLIAFRTDAESLGKQKFSLNLLHYRLVRFFLSIKNPTATVEDISNGNERQWEELLEKIMDYQVIYTDRAHVAIAGTMLEKDVHLFSSYYHKQKGIFEYSLFEYPNTSWHPIGKR